MKTNLLKQLTVWILMAVLAVSCQSPARQGVAGRSDYLKELKTELEKKWPANRTINLVFHGHSVPAGYFTTPVVNSLDSYPFLVLKELKNRYPYAVINVINTSVGGENSRSGAKRFATDVLVHKPDVLFIDYALNDRGIGLRRAGEAWTFMIREALNRHIKVILLTPSPDQRVNLLDPSNELEKHAQQISELAARYGTGLADSYGVFHQLAVTGDSISRYMSQVNHPNEAGHQLIANEILNYFQ
jgi:lysophospholipase L1-like esterase